MLSISHVETFSISSLNPKKINSISYAAAALWNKLPLALKQSKTTQNFKKNLKNWLTKDYISSREIINADITL